MVPPGSSRYRRSTALVETHARYWRLLGLLSCVTGLVAPYRCPTPLLTFASPNSSNLLRRSTVPVSLMIPGTPRSFWMVGSIFAATTAWVLLGDDFGGSRIVPGATWRHYALVAAIPAASALLLTYCFVPESPRFLAKAGRSTFRGKRCTSTCTDVMAAACLM